MQREAFTTQPHPPIEALRPTAQRSAPSAALSDAQRCASDAVMYDVDEATAMAAAQERCARYDAGYAPSRVRLRLKRNGVEPLPSPVT